MPRKELVWEGEGIGYLTENRDKRKYNKQVCGKILAQFPPK
jgi:hypothetical protein